MIARRKTTRRRSAIALGHNSPGDHKITVFEQFLEDLDHAHSLNTVISVALKSELTYFRRPMNVLHYRKVTKKVSKILEELVVPLFEKEEWKYSYTDDLLPMDHLKIDYKFITNMQYFPATNNFKIHDPFLLDALIPEKQNHVLVALYLRLPHTLKSLPEPGLIPKGTIPFIRVAYRIAHRTKLYTGETRGKWRWNLNIPTHNPIVIGIKNGVSGHLAVEVRAPVLNKNRIQTKEKVIEGV